MNNLPNRLTILRIIMVPFVMVFMLIDITNGKYIAEAIFIFASITDWLDGFIARKLNMITNFGKIMDPLADKLLVMAAMLCLVEKGICPSWCAILIIAREFLVTGLRVVAAAEGKVVAANIWGKVKTVVQLIVMTAAIFFVDTNNDTIIFYIRLGIYVTVFVTVMSGVIYIKDNKEAFR